MHHTTVLTHIPRPRIQRSDPATLTNRELWIARLVAQALSNKEIADELSLSERTVKNRLRVIFLKLGIEERQSLALWVLHHDGVAA